MKLITKFLIILSVASILYSQDAKAVGFERHYGTSALIATGITEGLLIAMPHEHWGAFMCGVVCTSFGGFMWEFTHPGADSWDDMKANFAGAFTGAALVAGVKYLTRDKDAYDSYWKQKEDAREARRAGQENFMIWWKAAIREKPHGYLEHKQNE